MGAGSENPYRHAPATAGGSVQLLASFFHSESCNAIVQLISDCAQIGLRLVPEVELYRYLAVE